MNKSYPLPKLWKSKAIEADCKTAKNLFRKRRSLGPLTAYLKAFSTAEAAAAHVISQLTVILAKPADREMLSDIASKDDLFTALRYLTAPPISADDLNTMLDDTVSPAALRKSSALANALVDLLTDSLDPIRFPWVGKRAPSKHELKAATLASAVVATVQRLQTERRSGEKKMLEDRVWKPYLRGSDSRKCPAPMEELHFQVPARYHAITFGA